MLLTDILQINCICQILIIHLLLYTNIVIVPICVKASDILESIRMINS